MLVYLRLFESAYAKFAGRARARERERERERERKSALTLGAFAPLER
jgi:hypothetical protein